MPEPTDVSGTIGVLSLSPQAPSASNAATRAQRRNDAKETGTADI
jgi:hypothetical protein